MICIECSTPVLSLYDKYKGDHIRLTVCQNCDHVVDKYIEFDSVLLFIDLLLLRPQAYRHTIYNYLIDDVSGKFSTGKKDRENNDNEDQDDSNKNTRTLQQRFQSWKVILKRYSTSLRLLLLMLLFEVYLTWAYEEKNYIDVSMNLATFRMTSKMSSMVLSNDKILLQYGFFILKALLEFSVFHLSIQLMVYYYLGFGVSRTMTFQYLAASESPDNVIRERSLTPERRPINGNGNGMYRDLSPLRHTQHRNISMRSLSPSSSSSHTTPTPSPSMIVVEEVSYPSDYFIAVISTAILLSNLIKIFPIVMLIWPYDNFILNITKAMVNIIHAAILIETLHIACLKQNKTNYWNIILVVFLSNTIKSISTNFILSLITSYAFQVPFLSLIYDEIWIRYKNVLLLSSYFSIF